MDRTLVNRFVVLEDLESQEALDLAAQLAAEISNDRATLVDLVQLLGDYLTKEDPVPRTRATACLAAVLGQLPKDKLTKQQTTVVTTFLSDRIEDEDALREIVMGLRHVVGMVAFSVTSVDGVLKTLEDHVNMRRHLHAVRHEVFLLLEALLARYRGSGDQFIKTYVALTSGEKDPRNLLVSFKLGRTLMERFDVKDEAEALFDVTFCYFPITFEPPKNDPYKITKDDLKEALRASLAANGQLAPFVVPGLIEKLNASSQAVKVDALQTLGACVESYSADIVAQNWQDVWDGVKFEVIHGSDEAETAGAALRVLELLSERLETTSSHQDYLEAVKKETSQRLEDPGAKLAGPAATLAAGVAISNETAFAGLAKSALGVMDRVGGADSLPIEQFKGVVDVIIKFLNASALVGAKDGGVLAEYKERMFQVLLKALASTDAGLRAVAVGGLARLSSLSALLDASELGLVAQQLTSLLLEDDNAGLCEKALGALVEVAKRSPDTIFSVSVPALVAALPDTLESSTVGSVATTEQKPPKQLLGFLSALAVGRRLLEAISVRLMAKLERLVQAGAGYEYPVLVLKALEAAVDNIPHGDTTNSSSDTSLETQDVAKLFPAGTAAAYLSAFGPRLVTLFVSASSSVLDHDSVAESAAAYLAAIVRRVPEPDVSGFATELLNLFVYSRPSKLVTAKVDDATFAPLSAQAQPTRLVALFLGGFAPLPPSSYTLSPADADTLMRAAAEIVARARPVYVRAVYFRIIALVANKHKADVDAIANSLRSAVEAAASTATADPSATALNALEALCWLGKGLVLRADQTGFAIADYLFSLLDNDQLARYASRVLGVLFVDDPVLSKTNHVAVRLLYKQRLFAMAQPRIVTGFRQRPALKVSYLVALASVLRFTPSKIVVPQLSSILPLLLEALQVREPLVQEAAINTIFVTLIDAAPSFAEHVDELVNRLLAIAQDRAASPASVRALALSTLASFPKSFERQAVNRHKIPVIRELARVLDDPRRDVRREAVVCRQAFYSLT